MSYDNLGSVCVYKRLGRSGSIFKVIRDTRFWFLSTVIREGSIVRLHLFTLLDQNTVLNGFCWAKLKRRSQLDFSSLPCSCKVRKAFFLVSNFERKTVSVYKIYVKARNFVSGLQKSIIIFLQIQFPLKMEGIWIKNTRIRFQRRAIWFIL